MAAGRAIITDKLVSELSGKTLEEWFVWLDRQGAAEMDYASIYALAGSATGLQPLGEWNLNLLTTSYEWSRGLKERGQKKDGFEISVSKTFAVAAPVLYASWLDEALRRQWLPLKTLDVTKATENKSVRIAWADGRTRVSVELYPKGENKAQMVVQHMKIEDAVQAAAFKEYWSQRLAALKALLA